MSGIQNNVLDRFVLMQEMTMQKEYMAATKEQAAVLYATENVVTFGEELMINFPAESRRKQYIGTLP